MPTTENPFRPTAGATPPEVIGRSGLLDEFEYGLELGSGAPGLLSIFTGARGIGKTVMLGAAHDVAREHGWAVIAETATTAFMGRIGEKMRRLTQELADQPESRRRITGLSIAGFSITSQLTPERQVDWRELGEALLALLNEHGTGLLITVDEIHAADRAELAQLAANVQHFIQDRLPIALIFAGLPSAVSDLLNEGVATFLRRADKIDLHAPAVRDVEKSYTGTFAAAGISIPPEQIQKAAAATGGYPFLIQLIGYFLWREAEKENGPLSPDAVDRAIAAGIRRNERVVIEAALATASAKDREFLHAMSTDDGPSTTADIIHRTGSRPTLVAKYRNRLIDAGLVESTGHGKVDYAIPGLREYLRKNPGS
ncbi:ATP-binding protein [Arthrobacter bambusae]|uniref:ATP-binding protein n=1 Tax=Arthrobacter TaxID=1663 RepID=UPI001F508473|nr:MULTISPECIES: ATP-binding protein [Arthrobacter]MCI0141096.1 ATP-binding protein [Arthrobacter bambusae]UYY82730.1 ATP-binding protein [Arthrobacter sp. YA7-1]